MVRKLSERTQAIAFLLVVCTGTAGLYGWVQASQPRPVPSAQVTNVSLVIDGPNWAIHYGPVTTSNNTAFGLLLEAARRVPFSLAWTNYTLPAGVLITAINGTLNGQGGMWWQYWVGATYGNRSASLYGLGNGDQVLWRFTTDQGGSA